MTTNTFLRLGLDLANSRLEDDTSLGLDTFSHSPDNFRILLASGTRSVGIYNFLYYIPLYHLAYSEREIIAFISVRR